ncbi:MAG: hypothetical protein FJ095_01605 [Deltaproteobacteria bacterium]|nr:hypothetical protein [Deltaproteobacteria bacterium]
MFRPTMIACPSCGCHALATETACPHCDAPIRVGAGERTNASMVLGLAVALTTPAMAAGCSGPDEPPTQSVTSSSTGFETAAAYGAAVTGPSTSTGMGGQGGEGGSGGK